jgi:putative ABC transport system substrate-binding protein
MLGRCLAVAALVLGVALDPCVAAAQTLGKVPRIGLLVVATQAIAIDALRASLRELGYVEGQTVVIEHRTADGRVERLPALAADLIARRVDVIVTGGGNVSTAAARDATKTIPIVMGTSVGAVEAGFIESLARPGGNITGLTMPREIGAKQVELLRELLPTSSRVAVLVRPNLATAEQRARAKSAALSVGLTIDYVDVEKPEDLAAAFTATRAARPHAMLVGPAPLFFNERDRVLEFARSARIPAIYPFRTFVDAGGLMSYNISAADVYRRLAHYVDRILKGAKPADLPVEQPTRLELVINVKTAKAIGITVPPSLLLRADHVIE